MSNIEPKANSAFPTESEFKMLKELGKMAVDSGFLPNSIKNATQAVIIMLKGRELGIPPMQAFSSIAVVNGRPAMSAELMLSLIYKNVAGAVVNFLETDSQKCLIEAQRPGGKLTRFKWTIEDAKRASLLGKGNWVTYPAAMLRARCTSAMARAMFPDALAGVVYTPEELGAHTTIGGEVVDVPQHNSIDAEDLRPAALTSFEGNDHSDADLTCVYCDSQVTWSSRKKKYECSKRDELSGKHIRPFGEDELQTYRDSFTEMKEKLLGLSAPEGA
jgi:hypothetical protein